MPAQYFSISWKGGLAPKAQNHHTLSCWHISLFAMICIPFPAGHILYRHIARFGMECISAGISCISAPLSHASLHLPALHAAPPYTSSSEAAPSSSSTPTSINFFQPLPDTFLSGKARRSLDRNCFSISNFLQGSARASLDLPRWILWSRSGFAHWRQLPHHCTLVADTDMKWHLPLICNKTTTLAAAFLGQVAIQSSSKFALSQSDPPLIGKVLKELYYGNVITIVVVYDAHIVWLFQLVQTPAFQGEGWNSWGRQYNWWLNLVISKRSLMTAQMRMVLIFRNESSTEGMIPTWTISGSHVTIWPTRVLAK